MLRPLLDRKSLVILGLNSGTSADGLDLVALRVAQRGSGYSCRLLAGRTRKYPKSIRNLILELADSKNASVNSVVHMNDLLGQYYGRLAKAFVRELSRKGIAVDAIASHGQTVRHLPKLEKLAGHSVRGTLQLGALSHIASLTNKVTLGDFRQADIAIGGEGAPITGGGVAALLGHPTEYRLIVNVGGMSNYFFIPPANRPGSGIRAADCGPGNVLSDLLCQRLFNKSYDKNGRLAAKGKINRRLLTLLQSSSFLSNRRVSTGREEFGRALSNRMITLGRKMRLDPQDLLATSIELTAICIERATKPYLRHLTRDAHQGLYLTGGGAHNTFLCKRLSERLGSMSVRTVAELGMDPDLVEAASFALMGAAALWSRPLPTRFDGTKRKLQPVLGVICQPPERI